MDRDIENLALDVPERLLDPADRAHSLDSGPPEILASHDLVQVLDSVRILADDEPADILDRPDDPGSLPLERRFAPAVESVLVGFDLDENPVPHPGVDDDTGNACDFHGPLCPLVEWDW
jgi:hypothetical protein